MQTLKDIHTHTHTHTTIVFDIPIIQKLYDFYVLLYQYLKLFPKKDRYSLGQKLENITLTVIELAFMSGTLEKEKKLPHLEKAIVNVDILKVLIRLAKDMQALDNKKYLKLEQNLQEIGKMFGGWRRSQKET